MRTLPNGHLLVTEVADLPDFSNCKDLYLDVETSGLDPYLGAEIVGVAVLKDDDRQAYYIPVGHISGPKIPREAMETWLKDVLVSCDRWINHNIKFDAHFCAEAGATFDCQLIDTFALSRIYDTDRVTYGLKPLCRDWLKMPMDEELRIKQILKEYGKDYGHAPIPSDIEGEYACMDVIGNRRLFKWLEANRDPMVEGIWATEILLTPILWDMERKGMTIDRLGVKMQKLIYMRKLLDLETRLVEMTGREYTDSAKTLHDLFVIQNALPILGWNVKREKGKVVSRTPSFDKEALQLYQIHPLVTCDPELTELVDLVLKYRKTKQFLSLYLEPYLDLSTEDGILHPSYRQIIRTGRMAGSHPNPMQLNKEAKALIRPRAGRAFLSADASQVEFRWIGHYTDDQKMIEAYAKDPLTDYHSFVAGLIKSTRSQGKTMNFAIGFGAQEAKVTSMLRKDADIMAEFSAVTSDPEEFERLCQQKAKDTWESYHKEFPGVKSASNLARRIAKVRGFVFNAFGRQRHLRAKQAYKAFNAVIQSVAMDYIKSRMVILNPRESKWMRDLDVHLILCVHDELVWEGPIEIIESETFQRKVKTILEECPVECSIPMRWDMGSSRKTWAQASINSDTGLNDPEALWGGLGVAVA